MPKQEANQPPILQSVLMSWSWDWEAVHGASCFALDHPQTCHPGYLLLGVAAGGRNVAGPGASSTLQAPLCAHPHPSAELASRPLGLPHGSQPTLLSNSKQTCWTLRPNPFQSQMTGTKIILNVVTCQSVKCLTGMLFLKIKMGSVIFFLKLPPIQIDCYNHILLTALTSTHM